MRIAQAICVASMLALSACGGDVSGENQATRDAQASSDAIQSMIEGCVGGEAGTGGVCDCPLGGTITVNAQMVVISVDQCVSEDGLYFSGTLTADDAGNLTVNMPSYGLCTDVTGISISTDSCAGTFTGVCAGGRTMCGLSLPLAPDEPCRVACD